MPNLMDLLLPEGPRAVINRVRRAATGGNSSATPTRYAVTT